MTRRASILSYLLIALILAGCQIKKVELGDGRQPPATVVILGSSTAAGTGPEEISNAWVNRYLIYAENQDSQNRVINLAKGGYTTYHMMPRTYSPPEGRPKPDPCRCITMALSLDPSAIVINLPSNDASYGFSVAEQLSNYDVILSAAGERNVPVWITTTQPRNLSQEGRDNLMAVRDSTYSRFTEKAIDFWSGLAQPDGRIDSAFDSGDGVHLNDAGHEILFRRVVDAGAVSSRTDEAEEEK